MFMIMFVLDNPDYLNQVLVAWEKSGIQGVTIIESTGMHRMRRQFIPMRYVTSIFEGESSHLTLMALVKDESLIQASLTATEQVVGDLNGPNSGIFASWPLAFVKGLDKERE